MNNINFTQSTQCLRLLAIASFFFFGCGNTQHRENMEAGLNIGARCSNEDCEKFSQPGKYNVWFHLGFGEFSYLRTMDYTCPSCSKELWFNPVVISDATYSYKIGSSSWVGPHTVTYKDIHKEVHDPGRKNDDVFFKISRKNS